MPKPFTLGSSPSDPQREVRANALPTNPLNERRPNLALPKWVPGIGQNSAQIAQQQKPWPPAGPAVPGGKPFKF
jgi:hypothetical protein